MSVPAERGGILPGSRVPVDRRFHPGPGGRAEGQAAPQDSAGQGKAPGAGTLAVTRPILLAIPAAATGIRGNGPQDHMASCASACPQPVGESMAIIASGTILLRSRRAR